MDVFAPELRNKIRKEVDFIKGAWVDFYDDLTVGSITQAQALKDTQDIEASLDLILVQIADWNFEKDGKVLPINKDSLKLLSLKLLTWISKAQSEVLTSLTAEKKSQLADNLSQPLPPTTPK